MGNIFVFTGSCFSPSLNGTFHLTLLLPMFTWNSRHLFQLMVTKSPTTWLWQPHYWGPELCWSPHANIPESGYRGVMGHTALGSLAGRRSPLLVEKVRSAWRLCKLMGMGSSAQLHSCSAKMNTEQEKEGIWSSLWSTALILTNAWLRSV